MAVTLDLLTGMIGWSNASGEGAAPSVSAAWDSLDAAWDALDLTWDAT